MDLDKSVNSRCICNKNMTSIKNEIIMVNPCEHLLHISCYGKFKNKICPLCNNNITNITRFSDFKKNKNIYQKAIDILCLTNIDDTSDYSIINVFINAPKVLSTFAKFPFSKGIKAGRKLCEDAFFMNRFKINVSGLEYIKDEPKIFISNHSSNMDFIILFYLLGTGFLAFSGMKDNIITRQLLKIMPCMLIDRGKKNNSVKKMKEYVKTHGSICLFPEGLITHPRTLAKFRTGAFNVGYPVYPIVINYSTTLVDSNTSKFILKLFSNNELTIDVKILKPFYPPFNQDKIENVRHYMAKKGNLMLSRVSNKDIKEEKLQ
jgi:1-acyl-sn-glycerol-3-phosphate acyltransferase